jgi:hypothetical protein
MVDVGSAWDQEIPVMFKKGDQVAFRDTSVNDGVWIIRNAVAFNGSSDTILYEVIPDHGRGVPLMVPGSAIVSVEYASGLYLPGARPRCSFERCQCGCDEFTETIKRRLRFEDGRVISEAKGTYVYICSRCGTVYPGLVWGPDESEKQQSCT